MNRQHVWLALLFLSIANVLAQDNAAEENGEKKEHEQCMEVMKTVMSRVRVFEKLNGEEVELKRSDRAITHYSDNTRDYEDGTLWAFTRDGRPLALTTCYTTNINSGKWIHATTSLSSNPLRCTQDVVDIWSPEQSGVTFRPLPDVPEVSANDDRLRRQARQLAQRFQAWQFWDPNNQRYELRLQARPVIEYSDPSSDVAAGATFLFTHGVNPELVLLVEAVNGKEPGWQYAFAKIGSAEFHATLDDREVYSSNRAPGVIGRPTDPYFMFFSRSHVTFQDILDGASIFK